jgi:hypothetical protein
LALSADRGKPRHFDKTLSRLVARGEIATVAITGRIKGITESERTRFIKSRVGGA